MRIRRATPGDQAFLWEAIYQAIHVPPGQEAPSREAVHLPEIACYVSGWMHGSDGVGGDLGFVAEDDGVPVGAAWLRCWKEERRGYGYVDGPIPELSMSLLPSYRGRGIGTMLLRTLLSAAEGRYNAVNLSVSESNPARRLYEHEGFVALTRSEDGSITMMRVLLHPTFPQEEPVNPANRRL